MRLKYDANY